MSIIKSDFLWCVTFGTRRPHDTKNVPSLFSLTEFTGTLKALRSSVKEKKQVSLQVDTHQAVRVCPFCYLVPGDLFASSSSQLRQRWALSITSSSWQCKAREMRVLFTANKHTQQMDHGPPHSQKLVLMVALIGR